MDCDDSTLTPSEKLGLYAEAWDGILNGQQGNVDVSDLKEVLEREGQLGFRPQVEYSRGGFKAIARSMEKYGLAPNDVREFLKWSAKNANVKKARTYKKKKVKKITEEQFKKMNVIEKAKFKKSGGEVIKTVCSF